VSKRVWVGNPAQGRFVIYLDGHRAGSVLPLDSLALEAEPGSHTVYIRQYWVRSPQVRVELTEGSCEILNADICRSGGFLRRFFRALFFPKHALTLTNR
jgi:hypothetical protein